MPSKRCAPGKQLRQAATVGELGHQPRLARLAATPDAEQPPYTVGDDGIKVALQPPEVLLTPEESSLACHRHDTIRDVSIIGVSELPSLAE
jgi:hypothetical protein